MEIIYGKITNPLATPELIQDLNGLSLDGTLYLGYPILTTPDERIFVDAMLISEDLGVVVFYFPKKSPGDSDFWVDIEENVDELYVAITQKLRAHRALRKRTQLAFEPIVVAYSPSIISVPDDKTELIVYKDNLSVFLSGFEKFPKEYYRSLNAALQRVSTIKPSKKRATVTKGDSRGAILKTTEQEIANLDKWQNYAANQGVPFTVSSNLVYALMKALENFPPKRYYFISTLSVWLRARLREMGFSILAPDAYASPAITTITLPKQMSSEKVGQRLKEAGYLLSYRSQYLLRHNWLQISLMGKCSRESIAALLYMLQDYAPGKDSIG